MKWIFLLIAGMLEISWAVSLKFTHGFSRVVPSVVTVGLMAASFYFLALAVRELPLGTAYAVWTGIGILGTTVIGTFFFGEVLTAVRLLCIIFVITGIIGLKITS